MAGRDVLISLDVMRDRPTDSMAQRPEQGIGAATDWCTADGAAACVLPLARPAALVRRDRED